MTFTEFLTLPQYGFLRSAFALCAMASVAFGLIGTFVVTRRIGYLAGAISHCAFGGVGVGLWLKEAIAAGFFGFFALCAADGGDAELARRCANWVDPVGVATLAAVGAALCIGVIQKYVGEREDTVIGMLWTVGMAVGLLFLDRTPGNVSSSITGYLFGDILLISNTDLCSVAALSGCVCVVCLFFFRQLQAICFDEEFARMRGLPVDRYFRLLLTLVALTVVLMLRVVGMVLVIALLTIPAACASRITQRLGPMIIYSVVFCFAGSWIGLALSYALNFSAGPTIILVVAALYGLTVCLTRRKRFS